MKYKAKYAKKRREAMTTIAVIGVATLCVTTYLFINRMAVSWKAPDFEISTYRDKEARIVGRTYELEHQEALFESLKQSVDMHYIATKGSKKRAAHGLAATFSETFNQELIVVVRTHPENAKKWEGTFTREQVDQGVVDLGARIGKELGKM